MDVVFEVDQSSLFVGLQFGIRQGRELVALGSKNAVLVLGVVRDGLFGVVGFVVEVLEEVDGEEVAHT